MKISERFGDYLQYLTDWGLDEKTITEYRRFLFDYFPPEIAKKELYDLKLTDKAKVIQAAAPHGIHGPRRALSVFRQYLKYLKESNLWVHSGWDWRDVSLPPEKLTRMQYLKADELESVFALIPLGHQAGLRTRAVLELILATGLRIGEVCSLNRSSINRSEKEIEFVNIKTGEPNTVYINERTLFWLDKYLESRKDKDESLFLSGRARLLPSTHKGTLCGYTKGHTLGKKICSTLFRKTYVTGLVMKGVDIKSLQRLSRHKSPRTTLRHYAVIDEERAKSEYKRVMGG